MAHAMQPYMQRETNFNISNKVKCMCFEQSSMVASVVLGGLLQLLCPESIFRSTSAAFLAQISTVYTEGDGRRHSK